MSLKCKHCGKCFTQAAILENHERVHIGEKRHECKWCGKCCSQARQLRTHERVHTGEKPYACKQCGKCFSQVGYLRIHERVHTGEKPYECKQCGKCFSQAGNLRSHERVHLGEKPHECKQCGKCFSQAGKVHTKKRLHKRHSDESTSKHLLCKQKRARSKGNSVCKEFTKNTLRQRESGSSGMVVPQSHVIDTHSCWICQEEMSSEALLLQHYENHMRNVGEDGL